MPRGEHRASVLLSREENEQVFGLIGPKCQSLATAVVQLFTTEGPAHAEWKKKDTGVLCLIKDNSKRSYFFRLYCLCRRAMIWEHEVYMQIEYKDPRPYLHTFEAEEYMTAFNFANEHEAKILRNTLIEKIELRKHKREERRQRSMLAARANSSSSLASAGAARHNGAPPAPPAPPAPAAQPAAPSLPAPLPVPTSVPMLKTTVSTGGYTVKNSSKKPKTRKLTKADIGMPLDFKHISHVGWDANKGFDLDNLPEEEMRSFFSLAGVSASQLEDRSTRQFIYDFINAHGGADAVKEQLHPPPAGVVRSMPPAAATPSPAPPAPPAPPVPQRSPAPPHPPAPPSRAPPPPPARALPPPPSAPPAAPRNPPPPRPAQPPPASAPPSVPPPPPPPPPAQQPAGAPPPPPAPPAPPAPPTPPALPHQDSAVPIDARAALMESIRSGNKGLKRVETGARAPAEDNRSTLLSEIRQGVELRAVQIGRGEGAGAAGAGPCASGLAVALRRALDERSRAIHSSESEGSDAATSDDEWD